jgi:uncharacterized protein YndB with AHSA1/START domain
MVRIKKDQNTKETEIAITLEIKARMAHVWKALTTPAMMKRWMSEPEMELEIETDWKIGEPIVMKGFHHTPFENRGTVLAFEREKILRYNYLSSLSKLPDTPENYTIVNFSVHPVGDHTLVTINLSNFPTETIFKHVQFYWIATGEILKDYVEKINHRNDP